MIHNICRRFDVWIESYKIERILRPGYMPKKKKKYKKQSLSQQTDDGDNERFDMPI